MKSEATIDEPGFPEGFDPAEALAALLRQEAVRTILALILLAIAFALSSTSLDAEERAFRDSIDYDDEPVDDEERAAIAERDETDYIPLDEYFGRRAARAANS